MLPFAFPPRSVLIGMLSESGFALQADSLFLQYSAETK